ARLFGAAQATRASMRATPGIFGGYWAQQQGELRAVLGDAAFDDAYGEGAELGLDEAAALALDVEHPDLAADSTRFSTGLSQPTPRRPADPDRHPATRTEGA
ncbi:adenylate/guanylate cyclase domain-containing protein, partial [Micromonospora sp. M51]|nr:adenylate/guanylate cyclase domain-containing protein [Micromonospora sp. M51]